MRPLLVHTLRAACGCQIPLPTERRVPRSAGGKRAAALLRNLQGLGGSPLAVTSGKRPDSSAPIPTLVAQPEPLGTRYALSERVEGGARPIDAR